MDGSFLNYMIYAYGPKAHIFCEFKVHVFRQLEISHRLFSISSI